MRRFNTNQILLISIILLSLFLGLKGGFVKHHLDSEFASTSQNKTYFLHSIYKGLAGIELWINQEFLNQYIDMPIENFMGLRITNSATLYIVASIFCILGVWACYAVGKILANETIGLLASLFLGTSYMWSSYLHYSTVDLPVTALCILTYYAILVPKIKNEALDFSDKIIIGILLGLSLSTKYAAALLLIPFCILHFDKKNYKKSLIDIVSVTVISLSIFAYFMSNKINVFDKTINYEIEALYKSGFIGFENASGQTYIYHLQHTLLSEFGFAVTIFGLIGIFFAYKQLDRRIFWSFISFPLIVYLVMGSMVLETPRYIMPLIPFLAISAAFGAMGIVNYLENKLKLSHSLKRIILSLIIIASISYGISMTNYHNHLLCQPGSDDKLDALLNQLKPYSHHYIAEPLVRFLPYGFRNIKSQPKRNLLDCESQQSIDVQRRFFLNNRNIVMLSSFWLDAFVYDWHFHCKDSNHRALSNYENLHVFEISPFKVDKSKVPFAHESLFSPKPPDIWFRKKRGLYYEILIKDDELADRFETLAKKLDIEFKHKRGKDSFYLTRIQGYNDKK